MQDLEKKSVTDSPDIKTCNRYVDDVLATVKKGKTEGNLLTINTTNEGIKFTKKEEQDKKLVFLDVLLTKTDYGRIQTKLYRNITQPDQILMGIQ